MPSDPASSPGLGAALKRLGVALVNATLMLVALILLLAVVLAVQLRGIAQDGRAELRSQIAGLEQQIAETRSTVSRALAELEAMRDTGRDTGRETGRASPGAIRPQAEAPLAETAALQAALDELVERLARLEHRPAAPSALPDAGHDLRPDNQTWIRWLALSFIRAVAREIIGPESGAGSGI